MGKNEDGEEGLLEGSSRPRGFLADDDCSMLRRKSRAPGASPTDVVTSPGKHGVRPDGGGSPSIGLSSGGASTSMVSVLLSSGSTSIGSALLMLYRR